jgi:hypothetical protein
MSTVQNRARAQVMLGAQDLTDKILPRLISLTITEKRGGEADQLDLTFHDHDGKMAIPKEGAVLRISLGWVSGSLVKTGMVDKGSFKVDDVEWGGPPDVITIRGRSADLADAFRVRREVKRKNTTLGAIVRDIAGANGLKPVVGATLSSIAVPVLAQDQKSDMALLREFGRKHDAVATVKDGRLLFMPIGAGKSATGAALPAFTLTRGDNDKVRWRRAAREDYAGVEARWHDKGTARRKTVKVAAGASGKAKPKRLKKTFHSEAEAKQAATSEHKRVQRAAAELDYECALGRPDLYPERKGKVTGFKPEIDGAAWLIAEATHSLDANGGLTTKLKLEVAA